MLYLNFCAPPLPHLIVGGLATFRKGDMHERRTIYNAFDLVFVRSGELYIEEAGRRFVVSAGQYLILLPETLHKGYEACKVDTIFNWLHFYTTGGFTYSDMPTLYISPKVSISKYYKKDNFYVSLPQYGAVSKESIPQMEQCFDSLIQVEINKYENERRFNSLLLPQLEFQQVFLKLLSMICESREQETQDVASSILQHFSLHYKDPFDLNALAQEYYFHPGHIIRCVKQKYGYSPLQLLLQIRMEKAKQLLKKTDKPIAEIAEQVGFSNPSYFSKQFGKIVLATPQQYRRRNRA